MCLLSTQGRYVITSRTFVVRTLRRQRNTSLRRATSTQQARVREAENPCEPRGSSTDPQSVAGIYFRSLAIRLRIFTVLDNITRKSFITRLIFEENARNFQAIYRNVTPNERFFNSKFFNSFKRNFIY